MPSTQNQNSYLIFPKLNHKNLYFKILKNLVLFKLATICILILNLLSINNAFATSHNPQEFLNKIRGSKNQAQQIVEHFCATCHAPHPVIELGAPKISILKDWENRMTHGLDGLFQHTNEGYGAMPARGGCFECTDEELKSAIFYMLPESTQKVYK